MVLVRPATVFPGRSLERGDVTRPDPTELPLSHIPNPSTSRTGCAASPSEGNRCRRSQAARRRSGAAPNGPTERQHRITGDALAEAAPNGIDALIDAAPVYGKRHLPKVETPAGRSGTNVERNRGAGGVVYRRSPGGARQRRGTDRCPRPTASASHPPSPTSYRASRRHVAEMSLLARLWLLSSRGVV